MNSLDWTVVVIYLAGLITLSYYLGKSQTSQKDYYLGGNKVHWFPVAVSTSATQLSTNSMLGSTRFRSILSRWGTPLASI